LPIEKKGERKMNTVDSLQYAVGNAFGILGQVTADLTQEQADWTPPGIANPIGATYWHILSGADFVVHKWCQGTEPLSETGGWLEKALTVAVPEPEHGGDYFTYTSTARPSPRPPMAGWPPSRLRIWCAS
jgi:hypothetical protein